MTYLGAKASDLVVTFRGKGVGKGPGRSLTLLAELVSLTPSEEA